MESFEDLGRILCGALQTQAETRGIICTSLNILIQQNKEVVEGKDVPVSDASPALVRASARYDSHSAAANLEVIRSCAPKLLDVLSKIFHESGKDDGGSLQVTDNLKMAGYWTFIEIIISSSLCFFSCVIDLCPSLIR